MDIEDRSDLIAYLRDTRGVNPADIKAVHNLAGGVSNKTVKVIFGSGNSWVLKQALPKLRVKGDWYSDTERIFHEAAAMRWIRWHVSGKVIANLIFEDRSHFLLAMEGVDQPFINLKDHLLADLPKNEYFSQAGELLGSIHANGSIPATDPIEILHDNKYFQSLRISPYYLETAKNNPSTKKYFEQLISETNGDAFTMTHGDFSPKNLLIKNDRLILLDHEVFHFGDGTFDIGFFISHLLSKANHIVTYRPYFLEGISTFFTAYLRQNPLATDRRSRAVRHAIGCLLARVYGLSPLEYLSDSQVKRQKTIGELLIRKIPTSMEELVTRFNQLLNDIH